MSRIEIEGVVVEFETTSSSANPDQVADPEFRGIVMHAFHNWYRINGGEWVGSMTLQPKRLLEEFAAALKKV